MAAGSYDIEIERGEALALTLTLQNDDKTVKDLTSYSARVEIRDDQYDSEPLLLTVGDGITIEAATGKLTVFLPAADVLALASPSIYKLFLIDPSSTPTAILKGALTVTEV